MRMILIIFPKNFFSVDESRWNLKSLPAISLYSTLEQPIFSVNNINAHYTCTTWFSLHSYILFHGSTLAQPEILMFMVKYHIFMLIFITFKTWFQWLTILIVHAFLYIHISYFALVFMSKLSLYLGCGLKILLDTIAKSST